MTGTINDLFLAMLAFIGSHLLLSSLPVRTPLVRGLGEGPFRLVYSAVAAVTLAGVVMAYNAAPYVELWPQRPEHRWVPLLLLPFASILLLAGLTTRSITMVGGERFAGGVQAARGIVTVTRHPFLWGVLLWAVGHAVANGDLASLLLFGGFAVLATAGMAHIDHRRAVTLGSEWGPLALTSSVFPFVAVIQRRTRIDWAGIGWWRLVAGLALYVALLYLHAPVIGFSALPL